MRLVAPFLAALTEHPSFPREGLEPLQRQDPDERIAIAHAHELLEQSVRFLRDPDLGLKAARRMELGDTGALDFALSTAPTMRAAIEVAIRYVALVNDGLELRLEQREGCAELSYHSHVVMPRAAADFMIGGFYQAHRSSWLEKLPGLEVWFEHAAPASLDAYACSFPGIGVRFSAPWNGFVFDASVLDMPLPTADARLHTLVTRLAERLLSELPRARSVTDDVRRVLANELCHGKPDVVRVAQLMHMSARTLGRRLREEGTTFRELRDELRRQLALSYVANPDVGLGEVAFLLGFSDVAVFHRAFRRWTGKTPIQHRREVRSRPSSAPPPPPRSL
jgi:AraC-like DNA-binding protein